jgi:riboflavin synthase alpha subunit
VRSWANGVPGAGLVCPGRADNVGAGLRRFSLSPIGSSGGPGLLRQESGMFTGLVQAMGVVESISAAQGPSGPVRLIIDAADWEHRPVLGESIAVQGCCLTVAAEPRRPGRLEFDVVPETLAKTNLGTFNPGRKVNLERSLRASDLLGGHVVQGHIEGLGTVDSVQDGPDWRVRICPPRDLLPCIVPKGGVAVEGVSLTVASADAVRTSFEIALIPTTLRLTTLGELRVGDQVNLETDILSRTVVHALRWVEACRTSNDA